MKILPIRTEGGFHTISEIYLQMHGMPKKEGFVEAYKDLYDAYKQAVSKFK